MATAAAESAESAALHDDLSGEDLTPSRPWPGLASFAEADQYFFRGRASESDELARLVRREMLTVLFGRSGLGKTSLLNAGLFPRLREDLHLPVMIRLAHGAELPLREQVWQALAEACRDADVDATAPLPGASMWEHFHRAGAGFWNARNRALTPVLVFDQFEEMFTLGQSDDETRRRAAGFVSELSDLIENRPPESLRHALDADAALADHIDFGRRGCKVVLSFREDFLAEIEGLRGSMPSLMRNRYRLLPMDGHQAREVVDSGSGLVAPGVAERIIGLAWRNRAEAPAPDDYERMEVDPALLSVICSELNLRRIAQHSDQIGASLLASAEREILVDFYERSLQGVDPRMRVFIENELITEAGHRDSHALEDALALPGITRDEVDRLVAGRLLRVDDRFGVRRLELTHDVLTRVVKDSRDARRVREAAAAADAAAAAAAEREREALEVQRRNRRNAKLVIAAIFVAIALLAAAGIAIYLAITQTQKAHDAQNHARDVGRDAMKATDALINARTESEQAKLRSDQAEADNAKSVNALMAMRDESVKAAESAAIAQKQADEATARARQLTRDAVISNVIANAGAEQAEHPDRALLLGAEASHAAPERLDAQLAQLARLISEEGVRKMLRIGDTVTVSTTSPNGKRMAMGTDSGDVLDLDLSTWTVLHRLKGHKGRVVALTYDADATRLVSADDGHTVIAWQLRDSKEIGRVSLANTQIRKMAMSHHGQFVAIAGNASVDVWTMPGQTDAAPLRHVGAGNGSCLGFGPEDTTLLYGTREGIVAAPLAEANGATAPRTTGSVLAFTPDCRINAVLRKNPDDKRVIELRDESTDTVIGTLDGIEGSDPQIVFEPGGRFVAVRNNGTTTVWATQPLRKVDEARLDFGPAKPVALSPDGRWVQTVQPGGEVNVLPVDGGPAPVKTRSAQKAKFQFSPNGDFVESGIDQQGTRFTIWSLTQEAVLRSREGPYQADEVEFNRTGSVLATNALAPDTADFWDAIRGVPLNTVHGFSRTEFSPDGLLVAILNRDGTVDVRNTDDNGRALLHLPKPPKADVERFAISWDNRRLAVAMSDDSIHVYEIQGGHETVLSGHRGSEVVAFSRNGRALAVAGDDGVVRLYRFGSQQAMTELPDPHKGTVMQLAFSPDGKRLVSGGADRMVIVRNAESGQTDARLGPSDVQVGRLVFIGNGDALVSGEAKGERYVWDLRKGTELARLRATGGIVSSVDISPGQRRVAVLHTDHTVTLRNWDADSMLKNTCEIANRNLDCTEWRQFMLGEPYRKTCPALPAPVCR